MKTMEEILIAVLVGIIIVIIGEIIIVQFIHPNFKPNT